MEPDIAGDPECGLRWTRRTTGAIADELKEVHGIAVCDRTVARVLAAAGFRLRVNRKQLSGRSHPDRDAQFDRIAELRARCADAAIPIISVDTKKKELIGRFRNPGAKWGRVPEPVNDHDFRSDADGIAVPYAIYDLSANAGTFFVGLSHDTPEFAAECIAGWWRSEGKLRYPDAKELCILADSGGSNGCHPRAWKYFLQNRLADPCGLDVTVAHYPSGASKWNPIEHRLFSEVSKNWAGVPLETTDTILSYLRSTKTGTGLTVRASLVEKTYEKGIKIDDRTMELLNIERHGTIPRWNYRIRKQTPDPAECMAPQCQIC